MVTSSLVQDGLSLSGNYSYNSRMHNGYARFENFTANTPCFSIKFVNWGVQNGALYDHKNKYYVIKPNVNAAGNFGTSTTFWSLTGKHLCFVKTQPLYKEGLIVSIASENKYMNFTENITELLKPNISDSVPIVEVCRSYKSKKVFGVISKEYTDTVSPHIGYGFTYEPVYTNEKRYEINSIGEGGIWVCNKDGKFECGDCIVSSTVPGYGVLQDDDILHNYTVGKITCDCEFSLVKTKKQKMLCSIDVSDIKHITYDASGNIQYEDDLDLSGNQIYEYPYDTRFLLPDGTILDSEDEYHSRKANGEEVFIACFVGCVYYCG